MRSRTGPRLAAILDAAKERCVWGSDWPHTPAHDVQRGGAIAIDHRSISYERLVDDFTAALASAELTDMIMRENPARLYGSRKFGGNNR
jgi:predicted TIM-barrel fold metal-dependent hydrolase